MNEELLNATRSAVGIFCQKSVLSPDLEAVRDDFLSQAVKGHWLVVVSFGHGCACQCTTDE